MSPQETAAILTALAALIGSIVSVTIGFRNLKNEKAKLQVDRERFQIEAQRIQSEIAKLELETSRLRSEMEDIERSHLELKRTESEIAKLQAETTKLKAEFDEDIHRRLEESRLSLQDNARRRENIYNLQAQAFREILSHVYRVRLAVRELSNFHETWMREGEGYTWEAAQEKMRQADSALQESIVVERGVLPEDFFRLAHDVNGLVYRSDVFRKDWQDFNFEQEATVLYGEINKKYQDMVEYVRGYFGIEPTIK